MNILLVLGVPRQPCFGVLHVAFKASTGLELAARGLACRGLLSGCSSVHLIIPEPDKT